MAEFTALDAASGKPYRVRYFTTPRQSEANFAAEGFAEAELEHNYQLADGTPLRCIEDGFAESARGLRLKSEKFVRSR